MTNTESGERPDAIRRPDDPSVTECLAPQAKATRCAWIMLVAFALFTSAIGLSGGPAMGDHECINAQAARQIRQTGQWLIPHLAEIPRIRKTPLGIWLIAAASWLVDAPRDLPVTAFSARLPSALAGLANVLVVCWLGTLLYDRRAGLVAGFIQAGCVATLLYAHNAQVDMVLTLLTTLTFACFWRGAMARPADKRFMAAFYAVFALAMMAKAPLPLATVGLSLAVYWFLTIPVLAVTGGTGPSGPRMFLRGLFLEARVQFTRLRRLWLLPGIVIFLIVAGAWPAYVFAKIDNALALWRMEYVARFTGDLSDHSQPFLYYVPLVFGLMAPYLLSVPEAMAAPFLSRYRAQRPGLAFAFTWALVGTLFLSAASFKRPHYLLSLVPAYCLLLAPVVDRLFFGSVSIGSRAVKAACSILPLGLAAAFVIGGVVLQREYPSLLRIYGMLAVALLGVWTAASLAYARGRRTESFALLNLGVLVAVVVALPAIDTHVVINPEGQAFAREFREHGVKPGDRIYWVGGRPDASIEFYAGYRIRRLIDEMEMATLRHDRRTVSAELYMEVAARMQKLLAQDQPVYLILSRGRYGMMQRMTDVRARVVFALTGLADDPGDDLMVISQPVGPDSRPAARAHYDGGSRRRAKDA